jgi:predicted lactoylglutathione lyase
MQPKAMVSIAVSDLDRSIEFFTKLGFSFNPVFTSEQQAAIVLSDDTYLALLTEANFEAHSVKPLCDSSTHNEAYVCFFLDSRDDVDGLVEAALAAGGTAARATSDLGHIYGRSFHDPDGHHFEAIWAVPKVFEEGVQAAQPAGRS